MIDDLIKTMVEDEASDLHIKSGSPPVIRVHGELIALDLPKVTPSQAEQIAEELMSERARHEFKDKYESDFAYSIPGLGRFRCNVFRQRGQVALAIRRVMPGTPTFEGLGLPLSIKSLSDERRGLILVTGMTGAGKSTTCGAMISHINATRRAHIVTIEDPIEMLYPDKMSIVNQREIGEDTQSFAEAVRRALRQDPDVIFIGEMRDKETVEAGLKAAETGHLVVSTLHTIDATETINRIIDFYPPEHQKQARLVLAGALKGIVSQRLLPRANGKGRVPAVEILIANGRIYEMIVKPDLTSQIPSVIAEGDFYGMQSFDQSVLQLYQQGAVSLEEAIEAASNRHDFQIMVRQAGLTATTA